VGPDIAEIEPDVRPTSDEVTDYVTLDSRVARQFRPLPLQRRVWPRSGVPETEGGVVGVGGVDIAVEQLGPSVHGRDVPPACVATAPATT
jgi:hypothetical protein